MAIFWMRSHTFFVSTTSLLVTHRLLTTQQKTLSRAVFSYLTAY